MTAYDLEHTPKVHLERDLEMLEKTKNNMHVGDGPSARQYADISGEIREIRAELETRTEIEVYTEPCLGGCGKVFDLPEPDPAYICRKCSTMGRV